MIYLPIDKLLDKSSTARAASAEASPEPAVSGRRKEPQEQVTVEARGRGSADGDALDRRLVAACHRCWLAGAVAVHGQRDAHTRSSASSARSSARATSPGLHFKCPLGQGHSFDNRLLSQSYTGETFLTNDGRGLIVDFYVKWRVKDPIRFYPDRRRGGSTGRQRLASTVKDGIKTVVAQRSLQQVVSAERAAVTGEMLGQASARRRDWASTWWTCACSASTCPTTSPRGSSRA